MQLQSIQKKIYVVRDQKIMLDFDLADLYDTETKKLKQAVRRNSQRFPPDFMFELSKSEFEEVKKQIRSQNVTYPSFSNTYMPFAFTEQGVAMLASVLKNTKAVEVNIQIVRAFVYLRQYALTYKDLADRLDELEGKFTDVSEVIDFLLREDKKVKKFSERTQIGFKTDKR